MAYIYLTGESTPPVRLGPVHYNVTLLLANQIHCNGLAQGNHKHCYHPTFVCTIGRCAFAEDTGMYPSTYKRYSYHTCGDKGRLYNASLLCDVISTHHTDALGLHYTTSRPLFKQ